METSMDQYVLHKRHWLKDIYRALRMYCAFSKAGLPKLFSLWTLWFLAMDPLKRCTVHSLRQGFQAMLSLWTLWFFAMDPLKRCTVHSLKQDFQTYFHQGPPQAMYCAFSKAGLLNQFSLWTLWFFAMDPLKR